MHLVSGWVNKVHFWPTIPTVSLRFQTWPCNTHISSHLVQRWTPCLSGFQNPHSALHSHNSSPSIIIVVITFVAPQSLPAGHLFNPLTVWLYQQDHRWPLPLSTIMFFTHIHSASSLNHFCDFYIFVVDRTTDLIWEDQYKFAQDL